MDKEKEISLRDYFAAKCMEGLATSRVKHQLSCEDMAGQSYNMADAMLKEKRVREKWKKKYTILCAVLETIHGIFDTYEEANDYIQVKYKYQDYQIVEIQEANHESK